MPSIPSMTYYVTWDRQTLVNMKSSTMAWNEISRPDCGLTL